MRRIELNETSMNQGDKKASGFSLIEMLLVIAIASSLIVLLLNYSTQKFEELRRDKVVMQMQQILNAGMSFYLNRGFWPLNGASAIATNCGKPGGWTDLTLLQPNYLPPTLVNNPYTSKVGVNPYTINCSVDTAVTSSGLAGFYVATNVDTPATAAIIVGKLPLAYVVTPQDLQADMPPKQDPICAGIVNPKSDCTTVVANVSIPGQNLNNARSINFAGVFFSGSCVPAPNCPPGMSPNILVAPAGVTGINDDPTGCDTTSQNPPFNPSGCKGKIYPVSSFTAFARGDSNGVPTDPGVVIDCNVGGANQTMPCLKDMTGAKPPAGNPITADGTKYWRVCLTVVTEKGVVYPAAAGSTFSGSFPTQQGKMMGSIVAFTRCVPNSGSEKPGGSLDVWQQNKGFAP